MSSKTLNHLRVVVHFDDNNEDHNGDHTAADIKNSNFMHGEAEISQIDVARLPSSPPTRGLQSLNDSSDCLRNIKAEVLLIDDKALQLNLLSTDDEGPSTDISHKMHFDHVHDGTVDMIKFELAIVMDDLLLKQKNSCIIRFGVKQEMDINLFFDLFITFLNKRIYYQEYKLQYVKLECHGMEDSKNPSTENGFASGANLAGLDNIDDDSDDGIFRLSKNAKNECRSPRDLLVWLLSEYYHKLSANKGHERLQFTFSIADNHRNIFKVKLCLFNIYLDLMNACDRRHWHRYMEHMGEGCQSHECTFFHSGLTRWLSGHIEGIASDNTLLIFTVPMNIETMADTIEMFQMAHTSYRNRQKKQNSKRSSNDHTQLFAFPKVQDKLNNLTTNYKEERRSSLPLLVDKQLERKSISSYNINHITVDHALRNNSYSAMDFNDLSSWYRKIDERFAKICNLREKYFNRYFELKIFQISSSIENMFNSVESMYTPQRDFDPIESQENHLELHELFQRYHDARSLFRQLSVEIKDSKLKEILKIYLETKVFDLNNHALGLKQIQMDLCQEHLTFTFSNLKLEN